MQVEEDIPKPKGRVIGADLGPLSIEDLHLYVADLEAEIVRARGEIERKGKARGGAEALFGQGG